MADIKLDLLDLNSSFFSHIHMDSNLVAHKLAKLALHNGTPLSWKGLPPVELQGLL